jgi:hypothetical protein
MLDLIISGKVLKSSVIKKRMLLLKIPICIGVLRERIRLMIA